MVLDRVSAKRSWRPRVGSGRVHASALGRRYSVVGTQQAEQLLADDSILDEKAVVAKLR